MEQHVPAPIEERHSRGVLHRFLGRGVRDCVGGAHRDEPQVRFSVWDDGVARAAVSLDEGEARRLAEFVCRTAAPSETVETLQP